jgi:hypothetical protein
MTPRLLALSLACLAAFQASAQTVTTPPRAISAQQETPGVDSTFSGNVVPNAQTSTITINTSAGAPAPTPAPPPTPPPAPVPSGTAIAGASWAFGTVDMAIVAGATSYNIGASCGPSVGPVSATVSSVAASSLAAITTANPFDTFVPAGRANANPTYSELPQSACLGAPGMMGAWPVQVWVQACNSSGCSAWSAPVVAYCSWSEC